MWQHEHLALEMCWSHFGRIPGSSLCGCRVPSHRNLSKTCFVCCSSEVTCLAVAHGLFRPLSRGPGSSRPGPQNFLRRRSLRRARGSSALAQTWSARPIPESARRTPYVNLTRVRHNPTKHHSVACPALKQLAPCTRIASQAACNETPKLRSSLESQYRRSR